LWGRRNLVPDAASYLRGLLYDREKKAEHDGGKGKKRSGDHFDPNLRTAERLAKVVQIAARRGFPPP